MVADEGLIKVHGINELYSAKMRDAIIASGGGRKESRSVGISGPSLGGGGGSLGLTESLFSD